MRHNGLVFAFRGQSTSVSNLEYLSATDSKCLLSPGRSCLSMILDVFQFCHSLISVLKDLVFFVSAKLAGADIEALLQFLVCGLVCVNCKCAWLLVVELY